MENEKPPQVNHNNQLLHDPFDEHGHLHIPAHKEVEQDLQGFIPPRDKQPATPSKLPVDAAARKAIPVATGFVDYFPRAMIAVAELSRIGNDQHNPGKPLHWDRNKSGDEADALMRHFIERGTIDTDGVRHSAKTAWRAMALLEKELEAAEKQL